MSTINALRPLAAQATTAASASSSTANPTPSNQLNGNSFLTLLTAQLQTQDPLNPMDPNAFVSELVQFNQLQQLIEINQTLSNAAAASSGSNAQSNPTPGASQVFAPAQS